MVKKNSTFDTNLKNAFYCWFVRSRCVRFPCFKEFQKIFEIEGEIGFQSWCDFGKKHHPEGVRPSSIGVPYVKSVNLKSIVLRRYWSVRAETFTRAYYMYVLSICTGKHISSLWIVLHFLDLYQKYYFSWPFRNGLEMSVRLSDLGVRSSHVLSIEKEAIVGFFSHFQY